MRDAPHFVERPTFIDGTVGYLLLVLVRLFLFSLVLCNDSFRSVLLCV